MNLHGKVAIVTGAASGIGAEIVRLYLEAGAQVVGVDRNAQAVPPELHAKHPAALRAVSGDVSVEKTAIEYTRITLAEFGRIDIMVNNAGIAPVKPIHTHTPAEWDAVMNINVKSIYFSARHVVPVMQAQGGGLFLNTGSISSVTGVQTCALSISVAGDLRRATRLGSLIRIPAALEHHRPNHLQ